MQNQAPRASAAPFCVSGPAFVLSNAGECRMLRGSSSALSRCALRRRRPGADAVGSLAAAQLPLQPARDAGQSVTAAFEGWYQNPGRHLHAAGRLLQSQHQADARHSRRTEQPHRARRPRLRAAHALPAAAAVGRLTIKVPEGFRRQATHLDHRRQRPDHHAADRRDQGLPDRAVQGSRAGQRAAEDSVRSEGAGVSRGRRSALARRSTGTVGQPVTLERHRHRRRADNDPDLIADSVEAAADQRVRGASTAASATSRFASARPSVDKDGKVTTTATFSQPGDYILRAQVNDRSGEGGGGFQCCWTNAHVKVTITGSASTTKSVQFQCL